MWLNYESTYAYWNEQVQNYLPHGSSMMTPTLPASSKLFLEIMATDMGICLPLISSSVSTIQFIRFIYVLLGLFLYDSYFFYSFFIKHFLLLYYAFFSIIMTSFLTMVNTPSWIRTIKWLKVKRYDNCMIT